MALSLNNYTGNGVQTTFALNFSLGFLRREHITCRVGDEVDGLGNPVYRDLEWVDDGIVNILGSVPGNGVPIVFARTVPKEELWHDYQNGVPIEERNLDESNLQHLMIIHEFLDGRIVGFNNDLNLSGFKIVNLSDGTEPNDAVNRSQLEDFTGNAPGYAAIAQEAAENSQDIKEDVEVLLIAAEDAADRAELAANSVPLNNYSATTNPGVNNDSTQGYSIGSEWTNISSGEKFQAISVAVGAADWISLLADLSSLGDAAYLGRSVDGTLASNNDTLLPTVQAVKTYADNSVASVSAGRIVQIIQNEQNTASTHAVGTTRTKVGPDATITPQNAGNKIKITYSLTLSSNADRLVYFTLLSGTDPIFVGASPGSRQPITQGSTTAGSANNPITFSGTVIVDAVDTSERTYGFAVSLNSSGDVRLNRSNTDTNAASFWRSSCWIIVEEISQ